MKTCFLSIDVEKRESHKDHLFDGIDNLDNILNIFKKHNASATLFVTGEVLEYSPDLVKKWAKDFEIGCHNYFHNQLNKIDLSERERQVKNFFNLYKNVFHNTPKGFRGPRNVIDNKQFPILSRYGFVYDSSVFPRYPWSIRAYSGYLGKAPVIPYHPNEKNHKKRGTMSILEIPESPAPLSVPFVGTWLRKLGVKFFKFIFRFRKPKFISLSMHSWDSVKFEGKGSKNSGKDFIKQLDEIMGFLVSIGYEFKSGEQIYEQFYKDNQKSI